jgi:hypothetical protein
MRESWWTDFNGITSTKKDPSDESDGTVLEERLVNQTVELI